MLFQLLCASQPKSDQVRKVASALLPGPKLLAGIVLGRAMRWPRGTARRILVWLLHMYLMYTGGGAYRCSRKRRMPKYLQQTTPRATRPILAVLQPALTAYAYHMLPYSSFRHTYLMIVRRRETTTAHRITKCSDQQVRQSYSFATGPFSAMLGLRQT